MTANSVVLNADRRLSQILSPKRIQVRLMFVERVAIGGVTKQRLEDED